MYRNWEFNWSADQTKTRYILKSSISVWTRIQGGVLGEFEVLHAYNEIGSSDFKRVTQDNDHEESDPNPKTWQEKIRGDKYEEDKHIFQYKPLP